MTHQKTPRHDKRRGPIAVAALFRSTNTERGTASTLDDAEFGTIALRRNTNAKYVRLRMQPNGQLAITLPRFASERHALELLESSRPAIRSWRAKHAKTHKTYMNGDKIGQSHTLHVVETAGKSEIRLRGLILEVALAASDRLDSASIQQQLQPYIAKALQKEARAYLPRRLRYLADQFGFDYAKVRYGTQKGRWGSCSSSGTISLNVGLMALAPELIDYVLIHELCHTKNMNHSPRFWAAVEACLPNYKELRKRIKTEQPTVSV